MKWLSLEKVGGVSIIVGSLLFAIYSAGYPLLLPLQSGDYQQIILDPNWKRLALTALIGICLMLIGFYGVYLKIREESGLMGALGFLLIEAAYLTQACKVTWEYFLYPVIAEHAESAFLIHDNIIRNDPSVAMFRNVSSLVILAGIIFFCLTLYRSRLYPKAASVLIFAGALLYASGPVTGVMVSVVGIFTLAVGCLLLGVRLLKE
jgi:hypothetical protein